MATFDVTSFTEEQRKLFGEAAALAPEETRITPVITSNDLETQEAPKIAPTPTTSPSTDLSTFNFKDFMANLFPETQQEKDLQAIGTQRISILERLGLKPQTQIQEETTRGVPELKTQVNDIASQIQTLSNQALSLQNEAKLIPERMQQEATGRGITSAGLAPLTAGELRKNALQQASITSQALTLQAQAYTVMGKLSLAQDAADRAVDAQFKPLEQELEILKLNYEQNKDQLERIDKKKADALNLMLQERTRLLGELKTDKATITAMALAAMKNFPNDPQAQYAAQQALKSDNLQEAFGLVGRYQTNPRDIEKDVLDIAFKRQQIAESKEKVRQMTESLPPAVATRVQTIAGQLDTEQAVKNYQIAAETLDAVKSAGVTPTDDIQRIYAFAKIMDPNSVVREGEYNTVQQYSTALLERTGLKAQRVFDNAGFLTTEARGFINTTLENRVASSKKAFDNIYTEYGRRINKITGDTDGTDYLTDYSRPFTRESTQVVTINGTPYQVGQVYTNSKGQKGRVNADGSVTPI